MKSGALAWLLLRLTAADEPSIPIVLGDGSTNTLQLGWFPRDDATVNRFCHQRGVAPQDCDAIKTHVDALRDARGRFFVAHTNADDFHPAGARLFAYVQGELMRRAARHSSTRVEEPQLYLCPT